MNSFKSSARRVLESFNKISTIKFNYARLINSHPILVMLLTSTISVGLTYLTVKTTEIPPFSDPNLGFETRRTTLSGRALAYRNIDKHTSIYPDYGKRFFRQFYGQHPRKVREFIPFDNNQTVVQMSSVQTRCQSHDVFLIDQYVQLVLQSPSFEALFSVKTLLEICTFEQSLMDTLTQIVNIKEDHRGWSLPAHVACLIDEPSCKSFNDTNVARVKQLILKCLKHRKLIFQCRRFRPNAVNFANKKHCDKVPEECSSTLMYELLYILLSTNILSTNGTMTNQPVYSLMVLPAKDSKSLKLHDHESDSDEKLLKVYKEVGKMAKHQLRSTKLVGHKYGIKLNVFRTNFFDDTVDVFIGLSTLIIFIWLYTDSVLFSLAALLTVAYSVGLAYFIYRLVFRITFFPLINFLVIALLVATAGDDTFVVHHIFNLYRKQDQKYLSESDISEATANAALSMFVASVTTAAAFFSNLLSDIVVIKCFAVFSGTVMLMNYLVAVTWLPACIVAIDRHVEPAQCYCVLRCLAKIQQIRNYIAALPDFLLVYGLLPKSITRFKFVWIGAGLSTFIGACVVVFYHPRLSLSNNIFLRLFENDNPIQWYGDNMKKYFEFASDRNAEAIHIALVWGFEPIDDASLLNPRDIGTLSTSSSFALNSRTLKSLERVCELLDSGNVTEFVTHNSCFPKLFFEWSAEQICLPYANPEANITLYNDICCNIDSQQFRTEDFHFCLAEATKSAALVEYGHPIFESKQFYSNYSFNAIGIVLYFDTSFNQTSSYKELKSFYESLETAFQDSLQAMKQFDGFGTTGWFVTTYYDILALYDLQQSLLTGMPYSVLVSVAIMLVVVVWSTKTILVSLLCMATITATIVVTIASLIMLQFQLNIVESTIIVLTVGLSVVSPVHLAVGYKLAPNPTRNEKVVASLSYIAVPVACNNLTTCLAGCAMLRVSSAAYFDTGLFMILISIIGWMYSNLFFLSLLAWCGPQDEKEIQCGSATNFRASCARSTSSETQNTDSTATSSL